MMAGLLDNVMPAADSSGVLDSITPPVSGQLGARAGRGPVPGSMTGQRQSIFTILDPGPMPPAPDPNVGAKEYLRQTGPGTPAWDWTMRQGAGLVGGEGIRMTGDAIRPPVPEAPAPLAAVRPAETSQVPPPSEAATPPVAPAATVAAPETAGNINLSKITGPDEIRNLLTETAQTGPEVQAAGRGVIPLEQQKQLAADLGMTSDDLLKRTKGQAFNAEQAIASRNLLTQSADDVFRKAKAAQGGSDADIVAFQEALTRHRAIQEQVSGMTAEAGRALGSFRVAAGFDQAKALKNMIDQSGGRQNIEDIATAINNLPPDKLGTFTANVFRPTWKDKAKTLWLNLILSNPVSHAANVSSNFLTLFGSQAPEAVGTAVVRAARGGGMGGFTEAGARLYGYVAGAREGLMNAGRVIKTGQPVDPLTKLEVGKAQPFGQGAGRLLTPSTTTLTAEDELFKGMASRGEVYAQAVKAASDAKLIGPAWRQRVAELANNPTPEMLDQAAKHAEYVTFQTPLGPAGQAFMNWRNKTPGAYIFAPFVKTPTNILKYALERTPAGLAMKPVRENLMGRNGVAARDTQIARLGLGTAAATAIASWAAEGKITGAGDPDPNLRALGRAYGEKPPYSINIGGKWYSYRRLDPFASVIGPVADLVELSKDIPSMEADKAGAAVVTALANNLINKTYLQGLSDVANALSDPAQYGQRLVDSLAGSVIPSGVAQEARVEDPILRDTQSTLDYLRSRIPGLSQDLPPRRTILGDVVPREGTVGPGIVSPIGKVTPANDPVVNELLRLKTAPSRPQRKIGGVALTPQQYSDYVQFAGQNARTELAKLFAKPKWKSAPEGFQIDEIKAVFEDTRKTAQIQMIKKYPELLRGSIVTDIKKLKPDFEFGNSMFGGQ